MKAFDAFRKDLREDKEFLDRLYQESKQRAVYGSYDVLVVKPSHLLSNITFDNLISE